MFARLVPVLPLAIVLCLGVANFAAGQPSPYSAYRRSPYQASPYRPDYGYDYQPRNYNGQLSNREYAREQLRVVAASAGLRPPSIYTPWYDGSYRVRYGLGYYGPYYPRYYYGYSNYYRPWYRWYRPWGGSLPMAWGMPLPGLPWGPEMAPGLGPYFVPGYGAAPELTFPDGLAPGCAGVAPCEPLPQAPPVEGLPSEILEEAPQNQSVPQELPQQPQPPAGEAPVRNAANSRNAIPSPLSPSALRVELPGVEMPGVEMPRVVRPGAGPLSGVPSAANQSSIIRPSGTRTRVPAGRAVPTIPPRDYSGAYYW